MRIPCNLKIGGHSYEVFAREREVSDGSTCLGSCNNVLQKIWVETNSPQSGQEETLLHEIFEAINFNYEMQLSHPQITVLSAVLYQVLKDNCLHFGKKELEENR